ncbi:MAG: hypothetical protein IBX56_04110 [Methylomicrobium sp.]|nr:hypothetical protein [Methylomicrobium sp.]
MTLIDRLRHYQAGCKRFLHRLTGRVKARGKQKVFCVGRNKTGTTSLTKAMADLGYVIGDQRYAECLIKDWGRRDFKKLLQYCHTAEFFQDIPFSLPFTFQAVDMFFPGSKFILTVRDEQAWYDSMYHFHRSASVHGDKAKSLAALKEAEYCYKGFAYDTKVLVYDLPGDDPYHKETLLEHYRYHNKMVKDYFKNRPGDLLVLDVSEPDAYKKLCDFIGKPCLRDSFPWENKT